MSTLLPAGPDHRNALLWRFDSPVRALSSASVGGGFSEPEWLLNIGVHHDYSRCDLDEHAAEIAATTGLAGRGIAMFTAVDVTRVQEAERDKAVVSATVGVTRPTWAADPAGGHATWASAGPGTINLVAFLPEPLEDAAMVQSVLAMTEAKTQALVAHGVPGTGTASDAVTLVCPRSGEPEKFGGVRSTWGSRLALATYDAVRRGLEVHP